MKETVLHFQNVKIESVLHTDRVEQDSKMATVAAEIKDYDTEYEAFSQKLALNKKSFQKIMSSSTCEISTICQNEYDLLLKTKGKYI